MYYLVKHFIFAQRFFYMNRLYFTTFIILSLFLGACTTTKNIPENSYLLNDAKINIDGKINASTDLYTYLRQEPNTTIPLLGKVSLKIYNMAGSDTSKLANRIIHRIGSPPVIYSPRLTEISASQLQLQLKNWGYLDAQVDTTLKIKGQKIDVAYNLKPNQPYTVRKYVNDIQDSTMRSIMNRVPLRSKIVPGDLFNTELLEEEQEQVAGTIFRNAGYYNFSKDYVYFEADTTLNSHQVDLYLKIYPQPDSLPYTRYKINKVTIVSGFNPFSERRDRFLRNADTLHLDGLTIVNSKNKFLRTSSIRRNNYLKQGSNYSEAAITKTYESFSNMGAVQQVNIDVQPSPEDSLHMLDVVVGLTPGNRYSLKTSLDGTNNAGDFGIAPSISFRDVNVFNGSEELNVKLKGAYEFVSKESTIGSGSNYYEYGVETTLSFPLFLVPWLKKKWREMPSSSTRFKVSVMNQHRRQYTRQFFNAGIAYNWNTSWYSGKYTNKNNLGHSLELIDINYVRMPWTSKQFQDDYLNDSINPLLKESYKNQLIARTAYNIVYSKNSRSNSLAPLYTIRGTFEVAGLLPSLVTSLADSPKNSNGKREFMGVEYADYVKGVLDFARTLPLSRTHSLAFHALLGVASPYGNSDVIPFERRFFAGGPNGVRGWSTRSLGPGSYRRNKNTENDFVNQTGDIKLDLSVENRNKVTQYIEIAEFVDAGNIWTIRNYKNQPGGEFKFSNFYKEIALSYGVGLRFDLTFLLLRLDWGIQAYDPSELQGDRWVIFKPRLSRTALHFAIGYPF